jgi:probable phosphoglycerate mutase
LPIYSDPDRLPSLLTIVRHGESAGNVAREAANRAGTRQIELHDRDMDVPLSALGERQSRALGDWFGGKPERFDAVLASPYRRAKATAEIIVERTPLSQEFRTLMVDERLREKEFGILDGLTRPGIEAQFPDQAGFRSRLGKFYHRPPGGESWCDVILRLRSMLDTISLHFARKRVLIVTHQVVVLCFRYLLEGMDEAQILAIDREADIANCAITEYQTDPEHGLRLTRYNWTTPVAEEEEVTSAPDKKAAAP